MIIKKIVKKIFFTVYSYLDHVGFAKYIGVKMGQNVHIYGNQNGMFIKEPWCT